MRRNESDSKTEFKIAFIVFKQGGAIKLTAGLVFCKRARIEKKTS